MEEKIFGDAKIHLYAPNSNIVVVDYIENWDGPNDTTTAKEVVRGIQSFVAEIKGPNAMLGIIPTLYTEKHVLDYYQQVDFGESARAFVIRSFAAKIVGNMYLRASKNAVNENGRHVPTRLFTDRVKAAEWLQEQLYL